MSDSDRNLTYMYGQKSCKSEKAINLIALTSRAYVCVACITLLWISDALVSWSRPSAISLLCIWDASISTY